MCVPSLTNRVAHPVAAPLNAAKGGVSLFDLLRTDVFNGNAGHHQQQQPPQQRTEPAGVANDDVQMMVVDSTPGDFRHRLEEITVGETTLVRSVSGATSSSTASSSSPSVSSVDAIASKPRTAATGIAPVGKAQPAKKRRRKRNQLKPGKTAKQQDRHFVVHNYHDHANDPEEPGLIVHEAAPFNGRGGVAQPFPLKLHAALSAIEDEGKSDVASWQPHGRCFIVHKPKEFQADLLPKYFNLNKITSFQRQLNLYGFTRLSRGRDHGGYYHELFLRGRPSLCHRIVRTKTKGTKFKAASSPESEPDFYSMTPVDGPPPAVGDGEKTKASTPPPGTVSSPVVRRPKVVSPPEPALALALPEPIPFDEARRASFPPPPAEVFSSFKVAPPPPASPALSPITPRREVMRKSRAPQRSDEDVEGIPPLEVSLSMMMMFDGPQEQQDDVQPPPSPQSPPRRSASGELPIRRRHGEMDPFEPLPVEPNKMTTAIPPVQTVGSWAGLFVSSDARALELGAVTSTTETNQVSESSGSSSSSSLSSSSSSELDDEKELQEDILRDGGVDPIDDFVRSMISIDDDMALGDYLDVLVDC